MLYFGGNALLIIVYFCSFTNGGYMTYMLKLGLVWNIDFIFDIIKVSEVVRNFVYV